MQNWGRLPAARLSIAVIRADGTKRRTVASGDTAGGNFELQLLLERPTWSPDGRRLALTVRDGLAIVTVGGRLIRTYEVGARDPRGFHPSWSPDGKSIVFVRFDKDLSGSLYALRLSSGATRHLTSESFPLDDEQPDW